jgi:predicted ATPase
VPGREHITSREALRIPGEVVRLVPPLSLPDPGHRPKLEELNRTEAARLFYERASAASSEYVVGEEDAPALALLCRRFDGIPLVLELAAARVGMLTSTPLGGPLFFAGTTRGPGPSTKKT